MIQPAIECKQVRKQRKNKIIGPLTFALPQGCITAIVGQNGAGKSTLMKLLLQLIHPDAGDIRWFGQNEGSRLTLKQRQAIAYVPESAQLEENHWTATEAAGFRSRWYPYWDQVYFDAMLDSFEVPRHTPLRQVSKGERRKFELIAALATRAQLLLLDEPFSGMDPFAWTNMLEAITRYMEEREATILISTHVMEEVRRLADYIALMHRGQLLGVAEKDSLADAWQELWVQTADAKALGELAVLLPEALRLTRHTATMASFVIRPTPGLEEELGSCGMQVLKSRKLDMEEVLGLWMEGFAPNSINEWSEA